MRILIGCYLIKVVAAVVPIQRMSSVEVQIDFLKVLLSMVCDKSWITSGQTTLQLCNLCQELVLGED